MVILLWTILCLGDARASHFKTWLDRRAGAEVDDAIVNVGTAERLRRDEVGPEVNLLNTYGRVRTYPAEAARLEESFPADARDWDDFAPGLRRRLIESLAALSRTRTEADYADELGRFVAGVNAALFLSDAPISHWLTAGDEAFAKNAALGKRRLLITGAVLNLIFFGSAGLGVTGMLFAPPGYAAVPAVGGTVGGLAGVLWLARGLRIADLIDKTVYVNWRNARVKELIEEVAAETPGAPEGKVERVRWFFGIYAGERIHSLPLRCAPFLALSAEAT